MAFVLLKAIPHFLFLLLKTQASQVHKAENKCYTELLIADIQIFLLIRDPILHGYKISGDQKKEETI